MKEQMYRGKMTMIDDTKGLELSIKKSKYTGCIYSDALKVSQSFLPKLWIKWNGKERRIKLKTLLGDTIDIPEDALRKMNLKMTKLRWGNKYIKLMDYNKPNRQANRIPLLAISKSLKKRIGRLSINVEKEYKNRKKRFPSWTGAKIT